MLTASQREILQQSGLQDIVLSEDEIFAISQLSDCSQLSDTHLVAFVQIANALYRAGEPLISDTSYDQIFLAELRRRQPAHPFLHNVEPEPAFAGKTVKLPVPMLSTDKAYDRESIEKWLQRIEKAAENLQLDFDALTFRVTPKLDGYAAYDDGKMLYTRGDGRKGSDISRVFARGLSVGGNGLRGQGAGEIVVKQSYFNEHLAEVFENARNFQASIIKEKELNEYALAAIENGAAVFFPFSQLPAWTGTASELMADFDNIVAGVRDKVDYDVDGVVLEAADSRLKQAMGATRHHHRWQIAFKNNVAAVQVRVVQVIAQTSRSGRVNPVVELEPVRLSGALISRATAHHYGMVKELGIGPGTLIELTRSGLVIPKIERVIKPTLAQIPENCPSCATPLFCDSDYLYCPNNTHCPAQIEHTIEHFFKTLGNVDGFGHKTVEKLHRQGIKSVFEVYQLDKKNLQEMGFGDKTAHNLLAQLQRSRSEAIEDWRFLGAFGIHRMGLGNCERLLQHYPLTEIFNLTEEDIIQIEGFAEKTAQAIVVCLKKIEAEFKQVLSLGFNLIITPLLSETYKNQEHSAIFGKTVVFTGTMKRAKREDMKKQAKEAGAKVATSVTGKTDFLVAGEKTGAAKIKAAKEKGVTVLSEDEYLALLDQKLT